MSDLRIMTTGSGVERSERSERSGTPLPVVGTAVNPEVPTRARRRQFTKEYKMRILDEIDCCTDETNTGMILRREGLYTSYLSKWRTWRQQMVDKPAGTSGTGKTTKSLRNEVARLKRALAREELKNHKLHLMLDLQKKARDLLETMNAEESLSGSSEKDQRN